MMKHKSIRRGHSTKHKRSSNKRSSGKRSGHKRKRSGHKRKRSGHKRSSNKRKRSGHKRSSSKRITKKRSSKRRLYGGGDVPPFTASGGTPKHALHQNQIAGNQQAGQNAALRGGGVGGAIGTNCDFNYVAKDAAGNCDVGNVANKNIDTLLQMQANGVYDVPRAI